MASNWIDRRQGYAYRDVVFSDDGALLRRAGVVYRERPFSAKANRQFRIFLALALLFTFPGIPLLAHWGLNDQFLWILPLFVGLVFWAHRRIHVCPGCGRKSRALSTPHQDAPILYLCERCHTFFEHGQIDGGWPWK